MAKRKADELVDKESIGGKLMQMRMRIEAGDPTGGASEVLTIKKKKPGKVSYKHGKPGTTYKKN